MKKRGFRLFIIMVLTIIYMWPCNNNANAQEVTIEGAMLEDDVVGVYINELYDENMTKLILGAKVKDVANEEYFDPNHGNYQNYKSILH